MLLWVILPCLICLTGTDPALLIAVDASDPGNPDLIASLPLNGRPIPGCIACYGGKAFIGTEEGLEVADVSDPHSLKLIAQLPLKNTVGRFYVIKDYLYVPTGRGLFVMDASSNPPKWKMQNGPEGYERMPIAEFRVKGSMAWALDRYRYIHLISIPNPARPELISSSGISGRDVFFRIFHDEVRPWSELNAAIESSLTRRFLDIDVDRLKDVIVLRRESGDFRRIPAISGKYLLYWDYRTPELLWLLPQGGKPEYLDLIQEEMRYISNANIGGGYIFFNRRIVLITGWRGRIGETERLKSMIDLQIVGDKAYLITESGELMVLEIPERRITCMFSEPELEFKALGVNGDMIYIAAVRRKVRQ